MASDPNQQGDSKTVPPESGSTISSFNFSSSSFVPRAIKKKRPPVPLNRPSTIPTATASTSLVAPSSSTTRAPPPRSEVEVHLTPQEIQRLEQILTVIESSFSTHGLTSYRSSSGLLEKLETSEWIHLSQVLGITPIRALTSTLVDLKNAVKLRESKIIKVDETGYSISRKDQSLKIQELRDFDLSIWNDLTIHLENIPFNSSLNTISISNPTSFSLLEFLSQTLGGSEVQKLLLPALYDPKNPNGNLDQQDLDQAELEDYYGDEGEEDGGVDSQTRAYKASLIAAAAKLKEEEEEEGEGTETETNKSKIKSSTSLPFLPRGGGGFKGFCFIVLKDRKEVEKVLRDWNGREQEEEEEENRGLDFSDMRDEDGEEMEEREEEITTEGKKMTKGKGKRKGKVESSPREKAKRSGMKAITFSRWLELKREYLSYKRTLEKLIKAQRTGQLDELRNPPDIKDEPPHLQQQQQQRPDTSRNSSNHNNKRASSPSPSETSFNKRTKRASSPSSLQLPPVTGTTRHTRKLRTPSPLPPQFGIESTTDLSSSEVGLSIQGAFPLGCVLWLRNVHEKSSKTSLKSLFSKLLDSLQEGSGKGVEFVDYEKGLQTCYLRFSSARLASITESHFLSTITYHLEPTTLSPVSELSREEIEKAQEELRRPLMVELLKNEMEKSYWSSLPESTRKTARLGAGGQVGFIKEPRGYNGGKKSEEITNVGGGAAKREIDHSTNENGNELGGGGPNKKRKKPSRM